MHWDGFHIVLRPDGEPQPGVLAVLPEQARAQAEYAMTLSWQTLEQAGYRVQAVDIWERK